MVVGVWELFLFLWSHPIMSCMVLLLFSPPFFPVIVYFSPLLICTGLVAVAMVSMNMGGSAEREEGWRDGIRRVHEPTVHVEMQLKPAKESWLEWMRKLEERAKAWVESRLLNQEYWRFGNITSYGLFQRLSTPLLDVTTSSRSLSAQAMEQHESTTVDNDLDKVRRISTPRELLNVHPQLTRSDIHALQTSRDTPSQLAAVPEASNNRSYFSVPETEEIKQVFDAQRLAECSPFEAASLERELSASLIVTLGPGEIVQGENSFLPAIVEEEVLPVTGDENAFNEVNGILLEARDKDSPNEEVSLVERDENTSEEEILPTATAKDESLSDEPPLADEKSVPLLLDESAIEAVSEWVDEGILPPAGLDESLCKASNDEGLAEVLTMKSVEESSASVNDHDQVDGFEPPSSDYGKLSGDLGSVAGGQDGLVDWTSKCQTSGCPDDIYRAVLAEGGGPLEPNAFNDGGEASREKKMNIYALPDEVDVGGTTESLIDTEKIIFVDEPSKIITVSNGPVEEEIGRNEKSPIQKSSGQHIVVVEKELPRNSSSGEGLDENIEVFRDVPSTPITASALHVSESMALLLSRGAEKLPSETDESINSLLYRDGLELPSFCEEKIEPVRSPVTHDAELVTALRVVDSSHSLKATNSRGEVSDDLTDRFVALKKSMSLYSNRPKESISLATAEDSDYAIAVPAFSPSMITRVERDPFAASLVFPEKQIPRPINLSGPLESVEVMTARLQKKYVIPNLAKEDSVIVPVKVEPNKQLTPSTTAIVPASVERDTTDIIVTDSLIPSIDAAPPKNGLPENSNLKKSLSAFLSRRREKLMSPLIEAFSYSSEGDRGKKLGSGSLALIKTGVPGVLDLDEGSTTTTSSSSPGGKLLKGKVLSPLKRVFSMDVNAGGCKKVDTGRVSSVKSSSVKDKHSVKDRPKDRLMKLFSFDGRGMSKFEMVEAAKPAVLDRTALRKSKSVSTDREQNIEVAVERKVPVEDDIVLSPTPNSAQSRWLHLERKEEENVPVQDEMVLSPRFYSSPSPCGHVETVDAESETKMLPRIETQSRDETGEVQPDKKSEPLPATSPKTRIPPTTIETGRTDETATIARGKLHKSSLEKKFTLSWMKKKRSSEPLDPLTARLRLPEEKVSLSGKTNEEESRGIFMSPLRRFNSSPAMNTVAEDVEEADSDAPLYENQSPETRFFRPSLKHRDLPKVASPEKRSSTSWWSPKADSATEETGESPEKRVSTSWWSRRYPRADSKAVLGPSISPLAESSVRNNDFPVRNASSPEKSFVVSSSSWQKGLDKSNDDSNSLHIAYEGAPHKWRSRGRSDSLPTSSSSSKFSYKLRERQASFSEATLSRTSEQRLASASGRITNHLDKSTSVSVTSAGDHYHHVREKRNGDLADINNTNNMGRRSNITTSTSYQIRPPVKTLDLAQELRNSFNRSDVDANNRHHRNPSSVAELSITDNLKVPLEEVLSLLSTGEKEDEHHHTTTAGTTVPDDDHRPSSSEVSSSNSSEEEWSSVSEDDDDEEEPQQPSQFVPLPPVGRIRRKLPHYIFSRGEATAN